MPGCSPNAPFAKLEMLSSRNWQAWLVGNHTRLYYIDAFNVTLARPAPRILLCPRQAAGPFGTAVGLASVEAVMRRVPTNMDYHAMRVGRVRAPPRVDVPPAVGRFEVSHAVVRLSAGEGHAPMAISRPIRLRSPPSPNRRRTPHRISAHHRAFYWFRSLAAVPCVHLKFVGGLLAETNLGKAAIHFHPISVPARSARRLISLD